MSVKQNILIQFGQTIRLLRKKRGLNQLKLAEKAGLHKNYVGMVERGERNPSLINISKLAKGLGVDVAVLFDSRQEDK